MEILSEAEGDTEAELVSNALMLRYKAACINVANLSNTPHDSIPTKSGKWSIGCSERIPAAWS